MKEPQLNLPLDDATQNRRRRDEADLFRDYAAIIRRLRAPDGCPWDQKQTLHSLRDHIVEESFELVAAINDLDRANQDDHAAVAEELGDVILVTMLISDALENEGAINLSRVLAENGSKLIRRHPHVFSDVAVHGTDEVVQNWHRIKTQIEGKDSRATTVSRGLPPLARAHEVQKKAAKVGFDWDDLAPALAKIKEELDELEAEIDAGKRDHDHDAPHKTRIEKEIGDLFFSVVNVARKLTVDPSVALARSTDEFLRRFAYIEERLAERGKHPRESDLTELDELWEEAKRLGSA